MSGCSGGAGGEGGTGSSGLGLGLGGLAINFVLRVRFGRAGALLSQERDRDLEACSGFPLRLVEANSSSCCSLIELYISLAAPLMLLGLVSPRLAASAAPF